MTLFQTDIKNFGRYATGMLLGALLLTSCGDDDDVSPNEPQPNAPVATGSYTFERNGTSTVDYSGQETRIAMLDEMVGYLKAAHVTGAAAGSLDSTSLANMLLNANSPFADADLNNSGKDIGTKLESNRVPYYLSLFGDAERASAQADSLAAQGQAGTLARGSGQMLVDENGNELLQLIEKGLFVECFFYQATDTYLGASKMQGSMNLALKSGKNYSDMEHHWDESFGYTGFNKDFSDDSGLAYNAKYIMARNGSIGYELGRRIHNAYELGRRNITEQFSKPVAEADYTARDAQIKVIRDEWETALAATAVSYLNKAQEKIAASSGADLAEKLHLLSEAKAFMQVMRYSDRFSATDAQTIMGYIGEDLYTVTAQDIIQAKSAIAEEYDSFNQDYK